MLLRIVFANSVVICFIGGGDYISGTRQINVPVQTTTQSFTVAIINVTWPGKTGHSYSYICTSTGFHFLSVRESYTHALARNTKYLTIDGQVCFHRRLFTDAVKPR